MGWVVSIKPRPIYPRERPGTHCTGGWVGPRTGLDGCGKSRPHRDSIFGPSSPQRVAVPTTLSRSIGMCEVQWNSSPRHISCLRLETSTIQNVLHTRLILHDYYTHVRCKRGFTYPLGSFNCDHLIPHKSVEDECFWTQSCISYYRKS